MKVREVMSHPAEVVTPDLPVSQAAARMRDAEVGALPVVEEERLVGMITDRDITVRVTAEHRDPERTCVRDIMTPRMVSCLLDDEVTHAARLMVRNGVRRLAVISADGELMGVVSVDDIAILFGDEQPAGTGASPIPPAEVP